ncbi:MAG: M61 family metallopeptidase [Hydrogenophaga sp.]|uniref:M61 family metallopeptidase n=1 Tax=Hydrogenophaga sp. TaxID=1904254 RepID=UPI001D62AAD6|nr:peptidase M61 [Hydrogenophaga sp.]MBX3610697.1 M61 family metallopeptidase [Hydrogenophaga sp.]
MATTRRRAAPPAIQFRVEIRDLHAHLFAVTLQVSRPARRQRFALPVWIPGSYLVREFSQHLQGLRARQGGRSVALKQLDKHRWQAECEANQPLTLHYEIYALDASVRTAWLDATRGFFNATSTCLRVLGQEDQPHALDVSDKGLPEDWTLATGLRPQRVDARGWGRYVAADYDELADGPVTFGHLLSAEFVAGGVPHRFVITGAGAWVDMDRLIEDTRRICDTQIAFWHGDGAPPFERYVFMLHASGEGYGGLEHRNSTALICQRNELPALRAPGAKPAALKATDGYTTLLGLISHEYFHTWNVKRLRPAEFARYDYDRENHTELLWFFEGFTSYYDDLFLRRAGLIDDGTYLHLVTKTLNQVAQTPGRQLQSVAQASFDAWVKYYRMGENTPNATVSYYTKGSLVALCLDLTLRRDGHGSLDDVMRALWQRCAGGPMKESDVRRVLREVGKRSFDKELDAWVHGTGGLPTDTLLPALGARVQQDPAPLAQQLGLRVGEAGGSLTIKTVLRDGAAERAGFAAGDEWLGVEFAPARRGQAPEAWRVQRLDDVQAMRGERTQLTALVARDRQLLRLALQWPAVQHSQRVTVGDATLLAGWLG